MMLQREMNRTYVSLHNARDKPERQNVMCTFRNRLLVNVTQVPTERAGVAVSLETRAGEMLYGALGSGTD